MFPQPWRSLHRRSCRHRACGNDEIELFKSVSELQLDFKGMLADIDEQMAFDMAVSGRTKSMARSSNRRLNRRFRQIGQEGYLPRPHCIHLRSHRNPVRVRCGGGPCSEECELALRQSSLMEGSLYSITARRQTVSSGKFEWLPDLHPGFGRHDLWPSEGL